MKRVLAVLVVLSSTAVLAQQQPERPPKQTQQRVQEIPFDDGETITGTGAGPDLDDISVTPRPNFDNLIRLRQNFDEKVMDSASQLP